MGIQKFKIQFIHFISISMYGEVTSRNHQAPVVQRLDTTIIS